MASFTFEIPDDQIAAIAEAVALRRGWTPTVSVTDKEGVASEVENPKSQLTVLKEATAQFWGDELHAFEQAAVQLPPKKDVTITVSLEQAR